MIQPLKYFKDHPAHDYALRVRLGKEVVGRWVRLAVERYFYDIEHQSEKGFYFDRPAAEKVIDFYKLTPHYKGEWAGTPVVLEPWQQFISWNIFGWKWIETGYRRFKVVYETVARKNGKTTKVAPVGLYLMMGDGEQGADVYSVAHDRKQAREVFDAARVMALTGPLKKHITVFANNLSVESSYSKFEPLTSDEGSHHGKNVHGALCDEVHVWPKRGLWSVLRTGMGARTQPIQWAITTAGSDQSTICYELHDYTQKILNGFRHDFNDDSFFGIIFCLDTKNDFPELKTAAEYRQDPTGTQEDDCFDESVWPKANPNLNISVKVDDMRDEALMAKQMPAALNDFLRLRMNIWTQSVTRWLSLELWDQNNTKEIYCHD